MPSVSWRYDRFEIVINKLYLCAASNSGRKIETAVDICKVKFSDFKKQSKMLLKGIKMSENAYKLIKNKNKRKDCKSKENKYFLKRFADSLESLAKVDCRIVINYSMKNDNDKLEICWKLYSDTLYDEITLFSSIYPNLNNSFSDCVKKDKVLVSMMKKSFLFKSIL